MFAGYFARAWLLFAHVGLYARVKDLLLLVVGQLVQVQTHICVQRYRDLLLQTNYVMIASSIARRLYKFVAIASDGVD